MEPIGTPPTITPGGAPTFGLNIATVAWEHREVDEWLEAEDHDDTYKIIQGLLYYTTRHHRYAVDYPGLVLPYQSGSGSSLSTSGCGTHGSTQYTMQTTEDFQVD